MYTWLAHWTCCLLLHFHNALREREDLDCVSLMEIFPYLKRRGDEDGDGHFVAEQNKPLFQIDSENTFQQLIASPSVAAGNAIFNYVPPIFADGKWCRARVEKCTKYEMVVESTGKHDTR